MSTNFERRTKMGKYGVKTKEKESDPFLPLSFSHCVPVCAERSWASICSQLSWIDVIQSCFLLRSHHCSNGFSGTTLFPRTETASLSATEGNEAPCSEIPHPNLHSNFLSSDSPVNIETFSKEYSKFLYIKLFDKIWDYNLLWVYSVLYLLAASRLWSVASDKSSRTH